MVFHAAINSVKTKSHSMSLLTHFHRSIKDSEMPKRKREIHSTKPIQPCYILRDACNILILCYSPVIPSVKT